MSAGASGSMVQRVHALFAAMLPGQPAWTTFKLRLGVEFGLADDTLHMMTGMMILTVSALVLRRAPWSRWPWLAVLVAETVNEAYDLTHGGDEGNWADSWHDFWITLLWPTIILMTYGRLRNTRSGDALDQTLE